MFWLTLVKDFIKILRAGQTPAQIAGGFALGALVGLSPMITLQGIVLWLIIFILNVNLSAAFLSFTLFALVAYLFDPVFHALGYYLLVQVQFLQPVWTSLYNAPVSPLTRFNNTVVMGSFSCALLLALPLYIGMKRFVVVYRTHIGARVEQLKIYRIIKKSTLVQWYERIRGIGE